MTKPVVIDCLAQAEQDAVIAYLAARGHLRPDDRDRCLVTRLTGGVSAQTLLVESSESGSRLVVKRALSKLLVAGDWTAKPDRAMTEAAAMQALHAITPDNAPQLLGSDPVSNTIVIAAAPADWVNWKTVLLGECQDPTHGPASVAATLGRVLGTWHTATRNDAQLAAKFADEEAFEQLRIAPFYRQIAARHPAVAARVRVCVEQLEGTRDCLVHGDYSPKNVLVGADGVMVLDFEVAHTGAPVFDVAFMQTHLVLKAVHQPTRAREIAEAAAGFLAAYGTAAGEGVDGLLGTHVAALLLARVDGLSPAGYLAPGTADTVRRLALDLLAGAEPEPGIGKIWAMVAEETR